MNAPPADVAAATVSAAIEDVERQLTVFLRRSRNASRSLAANIHPDLDMAGYAILLSLYDLTRIRSTGVRAADLAEVMGLHKSTASRNISDLERLDLIERVPDPSDARARLLRLTPGAVESLEASRGSRRSRLAEQLTSWPTSDLTELARLIRQLNELV